MLVSRRIGWAAPLAGVREGMIGDSAMRLDIYKDSVLVATFIYGASPRYFGSEGERLADLIAANAVVHNLWTQETNLAPVPDGADWWAARIICAPLARSGFRLRLVEGMGVAA